MCKAKNIDLGFAELQLSPGTHICQIYDNEEERNNSLLRFLLAGIKAGEKNACFSEAVDEKTIKDFCNNHGVQYSEAVEIGAFSLSSTKKVYFKDGYFSPENMLSLLTEFHNSSVKEEFTGARVIGEMIPEIKEIKGGERLLEYESKVTLLLKEHPVTAVCQYNANSFDGVTIMDVLKVHPMMIVSGTVVNNPFYIEPELFLKS